MDKELFFGSLQLQKTNHHNPPSQQLQTPADRSQTENKMDGRKNFNYDASKPKLLLKWIKTVRRKQLHLRKNRQRNLRIETILANALSSAEFKLRSKQLKISQSQNQTYSDIISQYNNSQPEPLCPELSSLDDFMKEVSEVKDPLQR
ncbi:uncharacterized protein LOC122519671 [Polistes fuscatus]|uniref:uncharacterized protein LOC122519671 n=1 Tax=Polistes fuscatus TaxID=30207 RepID=UPI001CAA20CF|nr:uncharacterized protein LOC122519671 [Polistes fuscatus]